jgi:hypothetical protein
LNNSRRPLNPAKQAMESAALLAEKILDGAPIMARSHQYSWTCG